jgi:hypothetical protein
MKPTFNANMFESIKSALENAKSKQSGSKYKEILKLDAPATYVVRLLPNVKAPSETFLHYYHHGWNSINTGQYVNVISPSTWGERCPVSELYFKVLRDGTDEEKARAKANISRKENWLVNVYVVSDPKNPENNGTVKVLRYGRQLNKIIEAAINGDDASEFGAKVFDLGANGCNLRIKAELVSDKPGAPKYPTYTASKFLSPSEIEGVDEDKAAEIYESIHDLNEFVEHKSAAEIQEFIQTHYYGKEQNASATTVVEKNSSEEEDVPYESPKPAAKPAPAPAPARPAAKPAPKIEAVDNSANDDKVKAILDGLDDL